MHSNYGGLYVFRDLILLLLYFSDRKISEIISSQEKDHVSAAFSALVNYCESVKFRGFNGDDASVPPRDYWQMSSFDESKAAQLYFARSLSEKFVRHNRKYLSRVYPKGTRVFSSNFDPIPLWLVGCQMVALNYQAQDKPLAFNRALFRANGMCGYVLKPEPLLNGTFVLNTYYHLLLGLHSVDFYCLSFRCQ